MTLSIHSPESAFLVSRCIRFSFLLTLAVGARRSTRLNSAPDNSSAAPIQVEQSSLMQAGQMLRDRYVLHSFLYTTEDAKGKPRVGKDFPSIKRSSRIARTAPINQFGEPADGNGEMVHLGTGTFGDVWKAFDKKRKRNVAIKVFYKNDEFLTRQIAEELGLDHKLLDAVKECVTVQKNHEARWQ